MARSTLGSAGSWHGEEYVWRDFGIIGRVAGALDNAGMRRVEPPVAHVITTYMNTYNLTNHQPPFRCCPIGTAQAMNVGKLALQGCGALRHARTCHGAPRRGREAGCGEFVHVCRKGRRRHIQRIGQGPSAG